ncbi:MAG: 2-oxo-4-hydroxy-4-carboxy-5-ureidoimidazoline decarboxylase [Gaiellaceae bacterium]
MRELPRELSVEELSELFEGQTELVRELASRPDPLDAARELVHELSEPAKHEALNAHPAIGASRLSARSATEQGMDEDPTVLAELATLNRDYETRHGFRFVIFVNGRPRREVLEVLKTRIGRSTPEERETALDELVSIAQDRWRHA